MYVCVCGGACVRASVRMCVCFRTQMFKCIKCIHAIFHGLASVRALVYMFTDMHVCMYARACMRTCSGVHVHILRECICV